MESQEGGHALGAGPGGEGARAVVEERAVAGADAGAMGHVHLLAGSSSLS